MLLLLLCFSRSTRFGKNASEFFHQNAKVIFLIGVMVLAQKIMKLHHFYKHRKCNYILKQKIRVDKSGGRPGRRPASGGHVHRISRENNVICWLLSQNPAQNINVICWLLGENMRLKNDKTCNFKIENTNYKSKDCQNSMAMLCFIKIDYADSEYGHPEASIEQFIILEYQYI